MSSEKLLKDKRFIGALAVLGLLVGGALAFFGMTPKAEAQEVKPAITAPASVATAPKIEAIVPANQKHVEDDGQKTAGVEATYDCNAVTQDSASTWDTVSAKAEEYGCKLKSLFFKHDNPQPSS